MTSYLTRVYFLINPQSAFRNPQSFDYFVRSRQHVRRDREADLLGRLEIDHQLKFDRLLDGEIGRLGSLQNFVHVDNDPPVTVREIGPVVHEPAGIYTFAIGEH